LNQLNLNTTLNHNLFSEFQLCVNKLYQSKDGQFILQKYQSDFSEYKISNRNTTHTSHFRLDRTFILNNERWLIDYKYHANDKDLTETANYYRTQLNNYANFFDEAVIHKSIYFLKQGKLVTLN
jgi:predicted transcriptional regulator